MFSLSSEKSLIVVLGLLLTFTPIGANAQYSGFGFAPFVGVDAELGSDGKGLSLGVDVEIRASPHVSLAARGTWYAEIVQGCTLQLPSPCRYSGWGAHMGPRIRGNVIGKGTLSQYLYLGVGPTTTHLVREDVLVSVLAAVGMEMKMWSSSFWVFEIGYQTAVPMLDSHFDLFQGKVGVRFVTGWTRPPG